MNIPLQNGMILQIDDADWPCVSQHKWYADKGNSTWYARANAKSIKGKRGTILLHRLILNLPKGVLADHRDGNGLNNRRDNLRRASVTQNSVNRISCVGRKWKGIYYRRDTGKWAAQLKYGTKHSQGGTNLCLGCYDTPEEAAQAYDQAAIRIHGEFARLNFPENA